MKSIIVTGGAGFIGCHLVKKMVRKYTDYTIICMDKLSYAGNLGNLSEVLDAPNFVFKKIDICDYTAVDKVFKDYSVSGIIHLAAESHVDRSIEDPFCFAKTNVLGTLTLLQAALNNWKGSFDGKLFYHISTDEVYGALNLEDKSIKFKETDRYSPHSPYSASKASSDHFVRAFHDTYGLPIVISNCSNNYGPNQYPEKLIPLCISRIVSKTPIPVYGKGDNVRDWLYVEDHISAIDLIFHKGKVGETYNIGGSNEIRNIDLVYKIISITDELLCRQSGEDRNLVSFVTDRPGHDLRYAIDSSKLQRELGWKPEHDFNEGLTKTIKWYLDNPNWLK